jgi:signal transduction histidine kinase
MMSRAGRGVEAINHLISDLLDGARIQVDLLELRLAPVDLALLLREVVSKQRELFSGRQISLALSAEAPVMVSADAERIAQVVINYLTNALKYSPEDAPVEVGLDVGRQEARLWVRDYGPGISPQEQTLLWERFYQVAQVAVQSGSSVGLGLGLYISRAIIERHHGQVGVESAPGAGATFWFTLPLLA